METSSQKTISVTFWKYIRRHVSIWGQCKTLRLTLASLLLTLPTVASAQGLLMPYVAQQLLDDNGDPCSACELYSFAAGTSTPQATYQDESLSVPNTNPIVTDAAGRVTVYLSRSVSYKFILKTAAGATVWTQDDVALPSDEAPAVAGTVQPGTILDYGGSVAPTGYLACNGAAVDRTTYATLYAAIGTTYGAGDGLTTFNLPSVAARVSTWTSYTPTLTNLTLGDGTLLGKYRFDGDLVYVEIRVTWGSSTSASGAVSLGLPVTADNSIAPILSAFVDDTPGGSWPGHGLLLTSSAVALNYFQQPGASVVHAAVTGTLPNTMGAGDEFRVSGAYVAASAARKGICIIKT